MRRNNQNRENLKIEKKKLFKKKLNIFLNNNFKWFMMFVVLLIFVLGYFFILKPKYEETLKLTQVITRRDELDIDKKQQDLESIKDFLLSYSKIEKKYMDKVQKILPSKYNQEELFTEFNHIVSKNELLLKNISISGITDLGKLKQISVRLEVSGVDYRAFKNLLHSLETNLKLIDVVNVNFNPTARTSAILINTYYLD